MIELYLSEIIFHAPARAQLKQATRTPRYIPERAHLKEHRGIRQSQGHLHLTNIAMNQPPACIPGGQRTLADIKENERRGERDESFGEAIARSLPPYLHFRIRFRLCGEMFRFARLRLIRGARSHV